MLRSAVGDIAGGGHVRQRLRHGTPGLLEPDEAGIVQIGAAEVEPREALLGRPGDGAGHHGMVGPERPELVVRGTVLVGDRLAAGEEHGSRDYGLLVLRERDDAVPWL